MSVATLISAIVALLQLKQLLAQCIEWFRLFGIFIAVATFPLRRGIVSVCIHPFERLYWAARASLEVVGLIKKWEKRSYKAYLSSEHWKKFREFAIEYYENKCAVCSHDYQKKGLSIQTHHFRYKKWGRWILGREHVYWDVCLLCPEHHFKGAMPWLFLRFSRREYEHFAKNGKLTKLWRVARLLGRLGVI